VFSKIVLIASFEGRYVWSVLGLHPTAFSYPQLKVTARTLMESGKPFDETARRLLERLAIEDDAGSLPILCNGSGHKDDPLSPAGLGF
jgi:hypothetical protein